MTFEPLTPERRREMTRRHLLEAAAVVFAAKGFHGATLDEVAAAAGFTKGAVYSNFKSKDDLFLALLDDRSERQFAVMIEVLEGGPHERGGAIAAGPRAAPWRRVLLGRQLVDVVPGVRPLRDAQPRGPREAG